MTTEETAILVAIPLLGIFVPLILFVRYALKYSDETFEPRYQPRTYRTSASEFFLSTDFVLVVLLVVLSIYLSALLFGPPIAGNPSNVWLVYALLTFLLLLSLVTAGLISHINLNYWKYTKDRVLKFEPETRTLTVQTSEEKFVIGEGDIKRIDVFSNESVEGYYGYYVLILRDGRELIITDKTKGSHAILDFFGDLPIHQHKRWLPVIHSIDS